MGDVTGVKPRSIEAANARRGARLLQTLALIATPVTLASAGFLTLENNEWIPVAALSVWLVLTAGVGYLICRNRPGNAVGPLMVAGALLVSLGLFVETYASYVYELGHSQLPLGEAAAWLTLWSTIPGFGLFIHLFLRFPTGSLLSDRWRWVAWGTSLGIAANSTGYAFRQGPVDNVPGVTNPLGWLPDGVSSLLQTVGQNLLVAGALCAIVSLVIRFRRAQSLEKQQLKWFVYTVALFPALFIVAQLASVVDKSKDEYLGFLIIVVALLLIPVSMGMGILRHRLYDIDVVVNRTLVYGSLTALLAGAYFAVVVLLQQLLEPVTKQSDIAVAGSTLMVAALARPALRAIQDFVDKRFYRRKYDAAETLEEFSKHLREQVNLDALSGELVSVVTKTMQPRHTSIWLRPGSST
jgi:hypothetical protein